MAIGEASVWGRPCWIDLTTSAPHKARDFYGVLLGWESSEASPEIGGYWMFTREGAPIAGATLNTSKAVKRDRWEVYVAVEDAAAALERGRALGGEVARPVTTLGDLGVMAVLADPAGATIGLWTARRFPGFGVATGVGAPRWFELHTHAYDGSLSFYRGVFSWDLRSANDEPGTRYATANDGDARIAGLMDAKGRFRASDPSEWTICFEVASADESLDVVRSLGGAVLRAAQDTPFGRVATVRDPGGAIFQVLQ